MQPLIRSLTILVAFAVLAAPGVVGAQATSGIPPEITTPERVDSQHRHAGV